MKMTGSGKTIMDVARMANVSPSTVTHALNGKRPVKAETRARVMNAISALGYVPSWNASRLKGRFSGVIGCLATDISETFVNRIVRGIEQGLAGGTETLLFVSLGLFVYILITKIGKRTSVKTAFLIPQYDNNDAQANYG